MTNPALGTKRNCPSCNVNFYDLNKPMATCPKCKHTFEPALVKPKKKASRRAAEKAEPLPKPLPPKKKVVAAGDEEGSEIESMDDLDDINDVEEINALEGAEDETIDEDDADEEAIMEEMSTGDAHIVDAIEEEEAEALVEEIEAERKESKASLKKGPAKASNTTKKK